MSDDMSDEVIIENKAMEIDNVPEKKTLTSMLLNEDINDLLLPHLSTKDINQLTTLHKKLYPITTRRLHYRQTYTLQEVNTEYMLNFERNSDAYHAIQYISIDKEGQVPPCWPNHVEEIIVDLSFDLRLLPSTLKRLVLKFNFLACRTSSLAHLPPNLTHLTLDDVVCSVGIRQTKHLLPQSLTHLITHTNNVFSPRHLPRGLKVAEFYQVSSDPPDPTSSTSVRHWPPHLSHLKLGIIKINHVTQNNALPTSLRFLRIENVERGLEFDRIVPEGVTALEFGFFDSKLTRHTLPSTLTRFSIETGFNRSIRRGVLPAGLTHFKTGSSFKKTLKNRLPEGLTHLTTTGQVTQNQDPLTGEDLPRGLVFLDVGTNADCDILLRTPLPSTLTTLIMKGSLNTLEPGLLPSSITRLDLPSIHQGHFIDIASCLPPQLSHLTLGVHWRDSLDRETCPSTLTDLVITDMEYGLRQTYTEAVFFPKTIVRLTLPGHMNIRQLYLPSSLRKLTFGPSTLIMDGS